ncbi:alpha/beta fold hydrolase [Streptacidiphilus monticola]|uniref:Alpha/beta fold hydrolase n=1 Tax=Streptacidiphilus monticola TaxID=2161674 RepID=A0ABW1G4J0_9ACTN
MSTPPFLTLPSCARSVRVETSRGTFAALHARPAGAASRGAVLLVPGFTGSKEDFIALLEPLAGDGWEVLAVDQRGQYETAGPDDESAYALEQLALDAVHLGSSLGAGRPVHLLGHSFGGLVARAAVLRGGATAPWASLTLMSSGPGAVSTGEAERVNLLLAALPELSMEEIWQAMRDMEDASGVRPGLAPEILEFLHRRWLGNAPASLAGMGRQLVSEPDRVEDLAKSPLPKLVLSGEEDYAWPVDLQADMALRLTSEHIVIPGAGHSPNAEHPAATAVSLSAFWSSVS